MRAHLYAQTDLTEAGLERRRLRGSCNSCRSCKTKCSGDKPTCERCLGKGLSCTYRPRARQIESLSSPQSLQGEIIHRQHRGGTASRSLPEGREEPESNSSPAVDGQSPNANDTSSDVRGAELPGWLVIFTRIRLWVSTDSIRLFSSSLPSKEIIYQLVDNYFTNIHPLRCYSFIHRPSFMERLDQDPALTNMMNGPLLHVICALGAK